MSKNAKKYNDSCIKIFEFIKMLYSDTAEFKNILDLFANGEYSGSSNTHVTINKYLNTLKIFGIKVKKINKKYKLLKSPFKIKFSDTNLNSIKLLQRAYNDLPESNNKKEFAEFINLLTLRLDEQAISYLNESDSNPKTNIFFEKELTDKVNECEKICESKNKIEIVFDNNNEEINLLCSPIELTYQKKRVHFKVLGNSGSRIYEIPINNIKSIKQLPLTSQSTSLTTTIVYKIKNRLANNYKLREWERLDKIEPDGSKIIVNKNEDLNLLLKRLMRYGTECTIISPKFFKEEMINIINETLKNYENIN